MSERIAKLNVTITYADGQTAAYDVLSSPTVAGEWFFRGQGGMPKELAGRGVDLMNSIQDLIIEHNHVSTD